MSTCQAIVDRQMENFKASLMIGNGFQVSAVQMVSAVQIGLRDAMWSELLPAPAEQGVGMAAPWS